MDVEEGKRQGGVGLEVREESGCEGDLLGCGTWQVDCAEGLDDVVGVQGGLH